MNQFEGRNLAETFMDSQDLLERLGTMIRNEIACDDEEDCKMAHHLLAAYCENPEVTNDIMMSLCGWTMESLMQQTY